MKNFIKTLFAAAIGTLAGGLFLFFAVSTIIGLVVFGSQEASQTVEPDSVLHLRLNGSLVEKSPPFSYEMLFEQPFLGESRSIGLYDLRESLKHAASDARIKGVYVEMENFDAGWAGVTALRRALLEFRASGKFLYAYADVLDEQSLYLLGVAEQLAVQPNGFVELNGLSATPMFFKGLLEKLEVEPRIFRVGKFKSAIEPFVLEKMSDENREQLTKLLADLWTESKRGIGESAKMEAGQIEKLASELTVDTAKSAFDSGLVANLMFEHTVRDKIKERAGVKDDESLNLIAPRAYLRAMSAGRGGHLKDTGKVAIVFADGEIVSGRGGEGAIGSKDLVETLREAHEDADVKAVVLRVNSPGGDALAADSIWAELDDMDGKIPVVASFGDIAASGGYYIAAGAHQVFAEPTTITGSIGVFGILGYTEKFWRNKLGVSFDRVVTNPYADLGNFNRNMSEYEEKKIQNGVDTVYSRFLEVVRIGRKDRLVSPVENLAEGRVWSGVAAKEMGLVDELGGLEAAVKRAAELAKLGDRYDVEVYPLDDDPFSLMAEQLFEVASRVMSRISGKMGKSADELAALAELSEQFERIKRLARGGVYTLAPLDFRIR